MPRTVSGFCDCEKVAQLNPDYCIINGKTKLYSNRKNLSILFPDTLKKTDQIYIVSEIKRIRTFELQSENYRTETWLFSINTRNLKALQIIEKSQERSRSSWFYLINPAYRC